MQLVRPSFTIWAASGHPELPHNYDEGADRLIEAAGRICYKSEADMWDVCPECGGAGVTDHVEMEGRSGPAVAIDCTTCHGGRYESSAEKFIEMIQRRGHFSVLEHSWEARFLSPHQFRRWLGVGSSKHVAILEFHDGSACLLGNRRALVEAGVPGQPTDFGPSSITPADSPEAFAMTVHFVCDRGVTHEIVRHRPASYSQESTRYCDYGGGHVAFIIPLWVESLSPEDKYNELSINSELELNNKLTYLERKWLHAMREAEQTYKRLRLDGWRPEQARSVLPNSLKTEIVMTASLAEWQHVFRLRCAKAAHPQMRELMIPLRDQARELFPGVFEEA